ncbi:MAG: hydantoinase B/oxoprolinase family protein [Deltaproteobacteria bacterium]|jgi:N-methylhydantoinase B|nr:hydantoinase B/oxoprolinase family protein [Deltaproteobacteria bacterium]
MKSNPILMQVFKNRFVAIAEEMGVTLNRTAFSPNIKERRDFSCALFDAHGDMIAQAAHIPVHLGSMPLSVKAAIESGRMADGDMVMLNNPFQGGTHLPDITLVAPVYSQGDKPSFYVANRAHHSDVGGMTSGSMPLSTSIFQEGVIISPLKIIEQGVIDQKVMSFFLSNVRTPLEREGDFAAQIMANLTGVQRCRELINKYGLDTVNHYAAELNNYSERVVRSAIAQIPDGTYEFEDFMDSDGIDERPIRIAVHLVVEQDDALLHFTGCDPQVNGSINAVYAITLSAVLYVFRSLIKEDIPTNAGCVRPLKIMTHHGTVVDAKFPAAVAGGNVETSQRIVDVVLGALSKALPDIIPAASQGTMNNTTIGGFDERTERPYTYYETLAGGTGATPKNHGESAVHSHMTNTLNTPIEALEFSYPFQITEYSIRYGSGGKGLFRGGDGLIREIRLLSDAEVTVLSERRRLAPYGLHGGQAGKIGKNVVIRKGQEKLMPEKFSCKLDKFDVLRIETPGGGGYGREPTDQGV